MRTRRRSIIATRGRHAPTPGQRAAHGRVGRYVQPRIVGGAARVYHSSDGSSWEELGPVKDAHAVHADDRDMSRVGEAGVEDMRVHGDGRVQVRIRLRGLDQLVSALDAASVKMREFAKLMSPAVLKGMGLDGTALRRAAMYDPDRRIRPTSASIRRELEPMEATHHGDTHRSYAMPVRERTTLEIEGHLA